MWNLLWPLPMRDRVPWVYSAEYLELPEMEVLRRSHREEEVERCGKPSDTVCYKSLWPSRGCSHPTLKQPVSISRDSLTSTNHQSQLAWQSISTSPSQIPGIADLIQPWPPADCQGALWVALRRQVLVGPALLITLLLCVVGRRRGVGGSEVGGSGGWGFGAFASRDLGIQVVEMEDPAVN